MLRISVAISLQGVFIGKKKKEACSEILGETTCSTKRDIT
jgi:hypothetical protein